MLKTIIFGAGILTGVAALPATLIYVKPVRTKIVDGVLNNAKKYFAAKIVDDADFRKDMMEVCSEVLVGLTIIDECSNKKGR